MIKYFASVVSVLLMAVLVSGCAPSTLEQNPGYSARSSSGSGLRAMSGGGYLANRCACNAPGALSMQSAETPQGMVFTLEDVLFDYDKDVLKPRGWDVVQVVARHMLQNPGYNAFIEGHTDNRGKNAYNFSLGQRRADATRAALVSLGIDAARISTKSYGEERPRASNLTVQGRQSNRRVQITLM